VPPGQVPGDGQAEAGSPVVAAAGAVEPYEPLEDPLALVLRHAVAVVGDLKHSPAVIGGPYGHDHFRRGVPLRVVDQIRQDPGQLPSRTGDFDIGQQAGTHRHPAAAVSAAVHRTGQGHLLTGQLPQVHPGLGGRALTGIQAGEQQQVRGKPLQPRHILDRARDVKQHRMRGAHFELGAQRGDGVAQFVGRVCDEPMLLFQRRL
jgi:hypothetical protein